MVLFFAHNEAYSRLCRGFMFNSSTTAFIHRLLRLLYELCRLLTHPPSVLSGTIPASHPNTIGSSQNHPCPFRSMLRLVCRPPWDYTNMLAHERCRDQSVLKTFLHYSSSLTPWFSVVNSMNQSLKISNDETFGYQKITHISPRNLYDSLRSHISLLKCLNIFQ